MYVNRIGGTLIIHSSKFSVFSSPYEGSFLFSPDPDFGVISDNSIFECSNVNYDWKWAQSQVTTMTMSNIGGAFHIENSKTVNPSVLIKNEFRNCYTCH